MNRNALSTRAAGGRRPGPALATAMLLAAALATTAPARAEPPAKEQHCERSLRSFVWSVNDADKSHEFDFASRADDAAFGKYIVAFDNWNGATATMWVNDPRCWGVTAARATEAGTVLFAPSVTRGWIYHATAMNRLSDPGTQNWTTKSGMGLRLSALRHARVHWRVEAPLALYPRTRWDALIDVFVHTMREPTQANGWFPQVDLQIIQQQMDSGYYAALLATRHGFNVTLGGNRYSVLIDVAGPFNQPGGHTITLLARPNEWADGTGKLWGAAAQTHDLAAILAYFQQARPLDDNGAVVRKGDGVAVTAPLLSPDWYLTAVNGDLEIDYGEGASQWGTRDFWVAVQDEPDGP